MQGLEKQGVFSRDLPMLVAIALFHWCSSMFGITATGRETIIVIILVVGVSNAACDAQFFPDLDKAVSEVVGCFNACAEDLLHEHMATGIRKYYIRLRRRLAGETGSMIQVGNTLVSYGCMNSLAVGKILKKYDKVIGIHHRFSTFLIMCPARIAFFRSL